MFAFSSFAQMSLLWWWWLRCRSIYRYFFRHKGQHNRAFTKRLQLNRSVRRKSVVQCWLCQAGTDQVTVSMSSYVFIVPAQRTYQRPIERMERKASCSVALAHMMQFPLSFRSLVADVGFKVSARPRETIAGGKSWFSELSEKRWRHHTVRNATFAAVWPTYQLLYLPSVITSTAVTRQKFPYLVFFFQMGNLQPTWSES